MTTATAKYTDTQVGTDVLGFGGYVHEWKCGHRDYAQQGQVCYGRETQPCWNCQQRIIELVRDLNEYDWEYNEIWSIIDQIRAIDPDYFIY
jgi:hypothetical protein